MTQIANTIVPTATGYQLPLIYAGSSKTDAQYSLLLLPALGMAARFYAPMALALAARGMNAVVMEQRGHGDSALRPGRTVNYGFREWLEEDIPTAMTWMREHFPNASTAVLGHSLGGHLAACYTASVLESGNRPRKLVLSACATPWYGAYSGKQRMQLRFLAAAIPVLGAALGYFPGDKLGFGGRESRRLMKDWRHMLPENRYRAIGMHTDFDADIARYRGDVLSIRFGSDALAPEKGVEAVLGKFRSASIERAVLTSEQMDFRADHFKWARQPDVTADLISGWMER